MSGHIGGVWVTVQTILQGDIPELREVSSPVESFDNRLIRLEQDLQDTLVAARGLGLSAPQIGVLQRVIVVDTGEGPRTYVNPKLVEQRGAVDGYESCLSFPDHTLKITRPERVTVEAQDPSGHPMRFTADGLLARVLCHEIDHLDGVLFMDHLTEEEMFQQLLANAFLFDPDEASDELPTEVPDADEASNKLGSDALNAEIPESNDKPADLETLEQRARAEELQLAADLLSDIGWKLELSTSILQDYESLLRSDVDWDRLSDVNDVIEEIVGILESTADDMDD